MNRFISGWQQDLMISTVPFFNELQGVWLVVLKHRPFVNSKALYWLYTRKVSNNRVVPLLFWRLDLHDVILSCPKQQRRVVPKPQFLEIVSISWTFLRRKGPLIILWRDVELHVSFFVDEMHVWGFISPERKNHRPQPDLNRQHSIVKWCGFHY